VTPVTCFDSDSATARFVIRVALTNARIVSLDDEAVAIQYKDRKTCGARACREFMCRSHKVRCFGLWHPAQRHNAERVRQMLQLQASLKVDLAPEPVVAPPEPDTEPTPESEPLIWPHFTRSG
jgi:hypothetical protein